MTARNDSLPRSRSRATRTLVNKTPTTIDLEHLDSGAWRATQPGVGLVGRGANPGRAVAHYGKLVAETVYESRSSSDSDSSSGKTEPGNEVEADEIGDDRL
jgi:hypothetical protein